MAKFRQVFTSFWNAPRVLEEMTPEDKLFKLYLITNSSSTQIGVYQKTKKEMAFELGYSIESVNSLIQRFEHVHKTIRYNPDTRELAIKNWGKYNFFKGGKPVLDLMAKEIRSVQDLTLLVYVFENYISNVTDTNESIVTLFKDFFKQNNIITCADISKPETTPAEPPINVDDTYNGTSTNRTTIGGQEVEIEVEVEIEDINNTSVDEVIPEEIFPAGNIPITPEVPAEPVAHVPYEQVKELFISICKSYPKLRSLSANRKKTIKARWQQYGQEIEVFKELFTLAEDSSFLKGQNDRQWKADFDWLLNDANMAKVLECKYNPDKKGGVMNGTPNEQSGKVSEYDKANWTYKRENDESAGEYTGLF